jgi:hypothetical protein
MSDILQPSPDDHDRSSRSPKSTSLRMLHCAEVSQQSDELGHEPPRLQRIDAAERSLIADTMADD